MTVIISFILFLFAIFLLARDDFVLLRKNVTTEEVFDTACIVSAVALLAARILFVALHFKLSYLNPLIFFLVPYFPGLSLPGALLGGLLWLVLFTRKKFPTARLMDILLLSFLFAFSGGMGIQSVVLFISRSFVVGGVFLGVSILSCVMSMLLQREFVTSKWRDGSVSLWMLTYLSIISLMAHGILIVFKKESFFSLEPLLFIVFLLGVLIAFFLRTGKREG